jgi:hypothetical protein
LLRYIAFALPLLILILALFGFAVGHFDLEPRPGAVIRLAFSETPRLPTLVVFSAWMMEACGLLALFLIAQGRSGSLWLDGLMAGWLAWVFRGPLLVLTLVVATRQAQDPWWRLIFYWWLLYSLCGLCLAWLASAMALPNEDPATPEAAALDPGAEAGENATIEDAPAEVTNPVPDPVTDQGVEPTASETSSVKTD